MRAGPIALKWKCRLAHRKDREGASRVLREGTITINRKIGFEMWGKEESSSVMDRDVVKKNTIIRGGMGPLFLSSQD